MDVSSLDVTLEDPWVSHSCPNLKPPKSPGPVTQLGCGIWDKTSMSQHHGLVSDVIEKKIYAGLSLLPSSLCQAFLLSRPGRQDPECPGWLKCPFSEFLFYLTYALVLVITSIY